jgi:hypothetical protein
LVGLQGDDKTYSDFDTEQDVKRPINTLGQAALRIRSVQYPHADSA